MELEPEPCFDRTTYEAMVNGSLAADVLPRVLTHLEHCERCQELVEGLASHKQLCHWMREGRDAFEQPLDKQLDTVLQRLLRATESGSDANEPTIESEQTTASEHYVPPILAYLSPAQQASELGRLGSYRVVRILGLGGMGVVLEALDPKLKRRVALKVMRPELLANRSAVARFLREAQAAAAVKHDHVVTIYQVDEERGLPFLAMEYLAGETLETRLARDGRLPLPEVLRIGREIAAGLAAAHRLGLTHRDIKPANIWLEPRVKILDFGLARDFQSSVRLTHPEVVLGTPAYMAPEQATGRAVDQRADLFSLGCILYRACTGRLPFIGPDAISTLMAISAELPVAPQALRTDIPGGLSQLIMQLLEKSPDLRPESADAVITTLTRLEQTLAAQHPALTTTANARSKIAESMVLRRSRFSPRVFLVITWLIIAAVLVGLFSVLRNLGSHSAPSKTDPLTSRLNSLTMPTTSPSELREPKAWTVQQVWGPLEASVIGAAFSPDSQLFALATSDTKNAGEVPTFQPGRVLIWDRTTGQERAQLSGHEAGVRCLAFSPDGRFLVTGGGEINQPVPGELIIWDAATFQEQFRFEGHASGTTGVGFTPDSQRLISVGHDQLVKIWNINTRELLLTLSDHQQPLNASAISPDGQRLATGGIDGTVGLWDLNTQRYLLTLAPPRLSLPISCLSFSPDSRTLVAGTGSRHVDSDASPELLVYDVASGQIHEAPLAKEYSLFSLQFTPDGKRVLAGNANGAVNVWDTQTWTGLESNGKWHRDGIFALAVSPDGRWLVSAGCWEKMVKLWAIAKP